MLKRYKELFEPEKIGGKIIIQTSYLRNFYFGLLLVFSGIMLTKLMGTELSMLELSILSSVGLTATLLMPLLGGLKFKILLDASVWIEVYMIIVVGFLLLGYISNVTFIYLAELQSFLIILIWNNLGTKLQKFIQKKTISDTAEYRGKGIMVSGSIGAALGTILSTIFTSITDDIHAFIAAFGVLNIGLIVVLIITNKKLMDYCYNNEKYPIINK